MQLNFTSFSIIVSILSGYNATQVMHFLSLLRSQNYLISAPALGPIFPLFWLRLQPYIDT